MASTDCLSSCSPQPNSQPDPPIAQAPKPTGVMDKSELPSCFVLMSIFVIGFVFVFVVFILRVHRVEIVCEKLCRTGGAERSGAIGSTLFLHLQGNAGVATP